MDESWRMRMGLMPTLPRRRSAEHVSTRSVFAAADDCQTLDPDDFADVFGGPPRSVLPREFSGRTTSFYEEIFRPPEFGLTADKSGRSLPAFRIPGRSEGFYSDIFGSDDDGGQRRSRERSRPNSKAKSNSSSVLSSEELSPLRPIIGDDVALSSFASKLRPLNVPCRWNSSTMLPTKQENSKKQGTASLHCNRMSFTENQVMGNAHDESFRNSYFGFTRKVLSPETISLEPNSYRSVKLSVDDLELNSPSSAVSSLCQEHEVKFGIRDRVFDYEKEVMRAVEREEDDEAMSSYVIEINSEHREGTCEAGGIEEAIAWAKEKFQTHSNSEKEGSLTQQENEQSVGMDQEGRPNNADEYSDHQQRDELHEMTQSPEEEEEEEEERTWVAEDENQHSEKEIQMELLDEDIRLWSAGRESNIRLLLSTLHHILWADSGWYAIPLTSLIESSQVKKAYQKARLCLHPDKLQQRGATLSQKHLAEKAFSILQDAWALFISQDVFII
ncbi:hypothetical protein PRUPE_4G085400 [Prunus persica]|uniref:J domain-containing protein n=1 Tax=Prunus persica TaxID=3760 RepID=A0A251PJ43_PRUPE|nr:J domain-containing protein required for chloroplast accumulation response 1 isoform X1 [Prunus persica]ONI11070.1 hypothetical protein PRUPE_4G085400 [Prunus persica]